MAAPSTSLAYATGSSATKDCHEQIVWVALDGSAYPDGATPPASEEAERLANQLPIEVPGRHQNLWAVSTVIGTRWPDFEGAQPSDFIALNGVHLDPNDQREHCLRGPGQDDTPGDPSGSRAAVASCRAFILEQVDLALGDGDTIDVNATETQEMWLSFVGEDDVEVQTFGFHVGQALHAIQDSFSHTVRTDDGHGVRHVLNYIEVADGTLDPAVDGHEHSSALDDCELGTPLLNDRVLQATQASTDLLAALADGEGGREGRLVRVRAMLDNWLAFAEGDPCVNDISSCDPPELRQTEAGGCAAGGPIGGGAFALLMGVIGLAVFRRRSPAVAALLVCGGLLSAPAASAQAGEERDGLEASEGETEVAPPDPEQMRHAQAQASAEAAASGNDTVDEAVAEAEAEGRVVVGVDTEEDEIAVIERREVEAEDGGAAVNNGVGIHAAIFGSIDDAGFGASLGVRIPLTPRFILGVDAEYDGWYSIESGAFNVGALNGYLTGIIVWATLDKVEIRTNIHAGVTVQLGELYNNDQFSVGPMFGITPVAIAVRVSRMIRLNIDPGGIFVEIPRISPGPPLLRRSHRLMIGITITP